MISRRAFMGGLASGFLAAPLAAQAQRAGKVYRIGYLATSRAANPYQNEALLQGLRDLGYVEGQNVVIESRFAEGNLDQLPLLIAELTTLKVDVLVTPGTPATAAAKHESMITPVVFAAGDPVGSGFLRGLSQPGGPW